MECVEWRGIQALWSFRHTVESTVKWCTEESFEVCINMQIFMVHEIKLLFFIYKSPHKHTLIASNCYCVCGHRVSVDVWGVHVEKQIEEIKLHHYFSAECLHPNVFGYIWHHESKSCICQSAITTQFHRASTNTSVELKTESILMYISMGLFYFFNFKIDFSVTLITDTNTRVLKKNKKTDCAGELKEQVETWKISTRAHTHTQCNEHYTTPWHEDTLNRNTNESLHGHMQ